MAEVKWIKLVSDMFDNRKIKQIRKMPEGDAIIVIWFQILCLAGNQGNKGLVYFSENIPYTDEMLSVEFDRNINTIRLAMNVFVKFEMIEVVNDFILISNWERYQSAEKIESIREYNREKKKEQRNRQKLLLNDKCQGQSQGQVIDCQDTDIISMSKSKKSLSSSLKENNKDNKNEYEVLDEKEVWFNQFWKEYPKKNAKKNAKSVFMRVVKSKELFDKIIQDIRDRAQTQEWIKNNGQFIPFPSTYLNQERWEDEVIIKKGMSFMDIE